MIKLFKDEIKKLRLELGLSQIFQIEYYKNNPDAPIIIYDVDDLKERLEIININKFKEKNTLADIAEVIDNLKVVII